MWVSNGRVRKKPVLYTRARSALLCSFLCWAMVPRTVADPTASVGVTNSVIHMRARTYTRSNTIIRLYGRQYHSKALSTRVHVPLSHEGSSPCATTQLPPSGAPRSHLVLRRTPRRALGACGPPAAR